MVGVMDNSHSMLAGFGILAVVLIVFAILLVYEHIIVKPTDISRVNLAFATMNGMASVIFACFVIADLCL